MLSIPLRMFCTCMSFYNVRILKWQSYLQALSMNVFCFIEKKLEDETCPLDCKLYFLQMVDFNNMEKYVKNNKKINNCYWKNIIKGIIYSQRGLGVYIQRGSSS